MIVAELTYGPVGDPESKDPFEWAQARMPEDWHVEGQHLDGFYYASRRRGAGLLYMWGRTPEALVDNVVNGRQHFGDWAGVRRGSSRGESVG